ncbi:hypothetical protein H0A71_13730 [Alcaligenaceae bacterium]|nr:hypothetical protein [Alcaligenaceae bacterium]
MTAQAQASNAQAVVEGSPLLSSGPIAADPLRGIVVNRTITTLGWDFYTDFTNVWRALHPESDFTLTITERPTAQYGSEIWIDYRDLRTYHTFLAPARSKVEDTAREAVQIVYQTITRYEEQSKLVKDKDLGPEEM